MDGRACEHAGANGWAGRQMSRHENKQEPLNARGFEKKNKEAGLSYLRCCSVHMSLAGLGMCLRPDQMRKKLSQKRSNPCKGLS